LAYAFEGSNPSPTTILNKDIRIFILKIKKGYLNMKNVRVHTFEGIYAESDCNDKIVTMDHQGFEVHDVQTHLNKKDNNIVIVVIFKAKE
jgi:hypothetical protein